MTQQPRTPGTEAGREHAATFNDDSAFVRDILAIEAEAATPAEPGLRAALERLVRACRVEGSCRLCGVPPSTMHADDCAVLAAIRVMEPAFDRNWPTR